MYQSPFFLHVEKLNVVIAHSVVTPGVITHVQVHPHQVDVTVATHPVLALQKQADALLVVPIA